MSKFEIEDSRELRALETQIPRREVAMDDRAGPVMQVQVRDPLAGAVEVSAQHAHLLRSLALVLGEHTIERRVAQDLLAAPPIATLPESVNP